MDAQTIEKQIKFRGLKSKQCVEVAKNAPNNPLEALKVLIIIQGYWGLMFGGINGGRLDAGGAGTCEASSGA